MFVRLFFYIPDYSRCFPQCHSSFSRPFVTCYPQNCREILSLTITLQSTEITSYALQAKLLFICLSTAFASFSTIHNHVQLVILFYPFPQSSSAELWSSWSFSALYLCSLLFLPKYNSLHLSLLNYITLFQCTSSLSRALWILTLFSNKFTVPPAFCLLQI